MTNNEIRVLIKRGLAMATAHSLEESDAYKFYLLKKEIERLFLAFVEREREIFKECGIGNIKEHTDKINRLIAENAGEELNCLLSVSKKANEMLDKLGKEEVNAEIKPVSFSEWHALQNENSKVMIGGQQNDILSGPAEKILENVFWIPPTI